MTGKGELRDVVPDAGDELEHPYSLVRTVDGVVGWLSGVLPYAVDGSVVVERDAAIAAALRVLTERVEAAGATLDDVVQVTVFLTDLGWRDALNEAWAKAFHEPRPARTAVEVRALPKGAPIELQAVVSVLNAPPHAEREVGPSDGRARA